MFIYTFENTLFINQFRKVVLSFPIPKIWVEELRKQGWTLKHNIC